MRTHRRSMAVMLDMPTLGRPPYRRRRRRRRLAALVILLAAAGLGTWLLLVPDDEEPAAPAPATPAAPVAAAPPPVTPPPPPADPTAELGALGMRHVKVEVTWPLESAFVAAVGRDVGAPLTQVVTRSLVWWISVPGDLRRGDTVEALFSERPAAEPLVHAVRFKSEKAGKTFEVFRFQEPGAPYARLYTRDGSELELRLDDAPLDDHEQVTSLLRDGRGHQGVDFRVPVGTPVKATFDAVVVRKNWNMRSNGTCLELRERGGEQRTAYFLHLSEVEAGVGPGDHVARGKVVARSGNSGRSFAPHLHYQLMSRSGRVLDPFAAQPTRRRALPDAHRAAFDAEVARLSGLLDRAAAR